MNPIRSMLKGLLSLAAAASLLHAENYLAPNGQTYTHMAVNWIKKSGMERMHNWNHPIDYSYQNEEQSESGVAFFGPSGVEYFSETEAEHKLSYTYYDSVRAGYSHEDKSIKRSLARDIKRDYIYYTYTPGDTITPTTTMEILPPSRSTPRTMPDPQSIAGTAIVGTGSYTIIAPDPAPYIPMNWADVTGTDESYYYRNWAMVTYSNGPIDRSKFIEFDADEDNHDGDGDLDEHLGFGVIASGTKPAIAIGDYVVPEGSSYGTCNSSLNIRLETPQQKPMLSSWRCKSATSYDTGLTIPSSAYSFSVTGTGATFTTTTTECGIYEIEVKTMFGTSNLVIVTNAPQFESIEVGVGVFETGQTLEVGPNGYSNVALEPGVYHFQMWLNDIAISDYRIITNAHWVTENTDGMGSFSTRRVDDNWHPDPKGGVLEVTITGSGLFGISAFATSPELPNANSPAIMIDISSGL